MIASGDRVYLTKEYEDIPGERFIVSQCDESRCWIGDKEGRGWYVTFNQIRKTKPSK